MYFGYYNRNSEEAVDVPIGPENTFDLGNGDQGQPTHFYPGRRWWVFKVVVPKDWPRDKRLVWTLTNKGRTNLAKGWLQPEWEVDNLLISKDAADPFLGVDRGNPDVVSDPPAVTGGGPQTITLPATATLTATASGGRVVRSGVTVSALRIRWILYRGPGKVQFDPDVAPAVAGKPVTSKVSFSVPGNYRIREIASDGALFSTYDVDVTVNPSTSAEKAH